MHCPIILFKHGLVPIQNKLRKVVCLKCMLDMSESSQILSGTHFMTDPGHGHDAWQVPYKL